jgi:predicted Kef-type K+ transport protein
MEFLHTATFINSLWVASAFGFGFAAKRVNLPPMLGFLIAGFLMNFLGITHGTLALDKIADLGIILLLFTIGLKLDLRGLTKPEIWGGATAHAMLTIIFLTALIMGAGTIGINQFTKLSLQQSALIAFALSFSSTVFAVKFLEEKGELKALHGRASIGILIMQDLMAVFFLTISKGEFPSLWALALPIFLLAARPILMYIIDHVGHGELLPLSGLFIALAVGTTSFSLVGLKPDLGALLIGMLIGNHARAYELSASLYNFKDLFLVGFFFQIGFTGIPNIDHVLVALGLVGVLVVKSFFYFMVLTRFKLRARTSLLATLTLSNYSEFGLLVAAIAYQKGWLTSDWVITLALALTFSFLLAAPLNTKAHLLYERLARLLHRFETKNRHRDDLTIDLGSAETLIFGMGPFGTMAYDTTRERQGDKVLAIDYNKEIVDTHQATGRRVIWGDATDYDFWHKIDLNKIKIIMLAMSNHQANLMAIEEIQSAGFTGPITAASHFEDHRQQLEKAGATAAYNIFAEAGAGYADHVCQATGLVCKTKFIVPATEIPTIKPKG